MESPGALGLLVRSVGTQPGPVVAASLPLAQPSAVVTLPVELAGPQQQENATQPITLTIIQGQCEPHHSRCTGRRRSATCHEGSMDQVGAGNLFRDWWLSRSRERVRDVKGYSWSFI